MLMYEWREKKESKKGSEKRPSISQWVHKKGRFSTFQHDN